MLCASVQVQNQIIDLCGRTIQEMLIQDVKISVAYSWQTKPPIYQGRSNYPLVFDSMMNKK